jgi:hypothetical protein
VKPFRFRALVTLDQPTVKNAGRQYASGTRSLMVHAWNTAQPPCDKYFPATIAEEKGLPLQPGKPTVVTITVTDDQAPSYFGPGQAFTLWGACGGHGIVSRRVFTDYGPS